MKPSSNQSTVPRLLPEEPFPPYSSFAGSSSPPRIDPAGHSYRRERAPAASLIRILDGEQALSVRLDLFNAGFFWKARRIRGPVAGADAKEPCRFLKALIQLAAAGVKHLERKPAGVNSHACRAAELCMEWPGLLPRTRTIPDFTCGS